MKPVDDVQTPPSKEFLAALPPGMSAVVTCDFCDRTHFGDGTAMAPGEADAMMRKLTARPDKYVRHLEAGLVAWGWLDGQQFVFGCPCNSARKQEDYIWRNRQLIADYMANRSGAQLASAQADAALAATVAKTVKAAGAVK